MPPSALPHTIEVSVEGTLDEDEDLDLLASEFCNVCQTQQSFEEARSAANNTIAVLEETVAELRNKEEKIQERQQRFEVLNEEKSTLVASTWQLTEQVSSLKASAISSKSYHVHETMLLDQISTHPNTFESAAEFMLYDLLGRPRWYFGTNQLPCPPYPQTYTPRQNPRCPLFLLNLFFSG